MWDIMLVNAVVITMDEERRIIPDGAVGGKEQDCIRRNE